MGRVKVSVCLPSSQTEPKASDLVGDMVAETGDMVAEICNLIAQIRRELIDGMQDLVALADSRNVLELHDLGSHGVHCMASQAEIRLGW
jgi:hypothetical protein